MVKLPKKELMKSSSDNDNCNNSDMGNGFDFFIEKARKMINEKKYSSAKSNLRSAQSINDDNFEVKIEFYRLAQIERNSMDASHNFVKLFFYNDHLYEQMKDNKNSIMIKKLKQLFLKEMKHIVYSINDQWRHFLKRKDFKKIFEKQIENKKKNYDYRNFYRGIWKQLTIKQQIIFVIKFSSFHSSQTSLFIDLNLFLLRRLAKKTKILITGPAIELINMTDKIDSGDDFEPSALRCLHRRFLFFVLPVLFRSKIYYKKFNEELIEKHFLIGIKYFIEEYFHLKLMRRRFILEKKTIRIIELIGQKLKWDIFNEDNPLVLSKIETTLKILSTYIHQCFARENDVLDLSAKLESKNDRKICFYTIILFSILFCRSMSKVNDRVIFEKLSGYSDGKTSIEHMNLKKRKLMNYQTCLISSDKRLIENIQLLLKFNVSIDFIKQEFDSYIMKIGLDENYNYLNYKICSALYEADYHNAMQILKKFECRDIVNNEFANLLYWLNYYIKYLMLSVKLNQTKDAAVFVIKIIDLLCSPVSDDPNLTFGYQLTGKVLNKKNDNEKIEINYCDIHLATKYFNSRQIIFLCPTFENVIAILIDACIILLSTLITDYTIGHIFVLSQYRWPYFSQSVNKVMMILRSKAINFAQQPQQSSKPTFIYPLFSSFIYESDILEEFQALVNDHEFDFQLEPMMNNVFKNNQEISNLLLEMIKSSIDIDNRVDLFVTFLIREIKPFLARHLVNQ